MIMTVKELIELLESCDGDSEVLCMLKMMFSSKQKMRSKHKQMQDRLSL